MQRYIYVHEKEYGDSSTKQATDPRREETENRAHDAEWWSSESRALIQYVSLWSAPDISRVTLYRILAIFKASPSVSANLLYSKRTPIVWIASFIQDHSDWRNADFARCRLLADCFEPNTTATPEMRSAARNCVRRAVAKNPPTEAGESRRIHPLDHLDLRELPQSMINHRVDLENSTDDSVGVSFDVFEQVFGTSAQAREEWELARVVDDVSGPYQDDQTYSLQLYAVEISGRGIFKGQKRPLIFSVILDAGCTQRSVLQALYPQMPRIARLIESFIFRPAAAYEKCIIDPAASQRRYQEVRGRAQSSNHLTSRFFFPFTSVVLLGVKGDVGSDKETE